MADREKTTDLERALLAALLLGVVFLSVVLVQLDQAITAAQICTGTR